LARKGPASRSAVSELLGHSSISITGDVYAHVSESTSRDAMEKLSNVIGL
jgi:integrase